MEYEYLYCIGHQLLAQMISEINHHRIKNIFIFERGKPGMKRESWLQGSK